MRRSIRWILGFAAFILTSFLIYNLLYLGTIFPNIYVAGINLGGMKPEVAALALAEKIKVPEGLKLTTSSQSFDLATDDIDLKYDFVSSTQRAYDLTRTGNILFDFAKRIKLLFSPQTLGLTTRINEEDLNKIISVISGQISVDPAAPSAKLVNGNLVIEKGQKGTEVDSNLLRAKIGEALAFAKETDIQIPTREVGQTLTDKEAEEFGFRAEKYIGKTLILNFEFSTYKITGNDILKLINPKGGFDDESIKEKAYNIAKEINREPQNPKFAFEGGKVTEFLPAKDGVELDNDKFKEILIQNLTDLSDSEEKTLSLEIPVKKTPPDTTTDKVNDLGIKELIGRGTSRFRGSIPSRVYNIQLASSRLNGILIKPGDTFSFNNALGDVSQFTGYQQAYVIREGKTILGDGGGVCQVSTTFFRAVLNAGLPISERQAHAYRVGYYEQDSPPGLDATVYGPSPDLKIKNDTPAHILIQAKADTKNYSLVFELYGTSDGRVATTSKPITADVVKPGEDLYIDDPTLPAGTTKQTEHRANGAKVTFNYLVQRGGETIYKKTFISNYRPWQAVYLRGTGPI